MAVSDQQRSKVESLLKQGHKIEAIKYLKKEFRLDLKKAKILADTIEAEIDPSEFARPSMTPSLEKGRKSAKIVGGIFFTIGLIFLGFGVSLFISDINQIENSVLVIGEVVSDPSQPTIEYMYNDSVYYYYSTTETNPPSYHLGEKVEVYVDVDYPDIAIVNTFSDRWFLIVFMGGMGSIFSLVGFAAMRLF